MTTFFQKTQQVPVCKPFSTGMDLDLYLFLATAKSQKNVKYLLQMNLLSTRQRGNKTLHRTTTDTSQNHDTIVLVLTQDHIHMLCYLQLLFICYLAESQPILYHQQGDSFTHLMLITGFLLYFHFKVSGSLNIMTFLKLQMDSTQMHKYKD